MEAIGRLELLIRAWSKLGSLDAGLAAGLRAAIGFPVGVEELAASPATHDTWTVLAHVVSETDDKLRTRVVWLHGRVTRRFAAFVDHAAGDRAWPVAPAPGQAFTGSLAFHPGAAAFRAVVVGGTTPDSASLVQHGTMTEALDAAAELVAKVPWTDNAPLGVGSVWFGRLGGDAALVAVGDEGGALLLADSAANAAFMSAAGGAPVGIFGTWDGSRFTALAMRCGGRQYAAVASPGKACPSEGWHDPVIRAHRSRLARSGGGHAFGHRSRSELPGGLAAVSAAEGAAGVLGALAATATYRRVAAEAHGELVEFPEVDVRKQIGRGGGGRVAGKEARATLLQLWLEAASNGGRRAPPEMVPLLLERLPGVVSAPAAQHALDGRDRWLHSLNSHPTAGGAPWLAGGISGRLRQLVAWRTKDPAAAREALAAAWASKAAEARAALIGALAVGLSQAAESFLETALNDRSGRVRNGATSLLVNMPESAFPARSEARSRQAATLKRSLLPWAAAKLDCRMPTVDAAKF